MEILKWILIPWKKIKEFLGKIIYNMELRKYETMGDDDTGNG